MTIKKWELGEYRVNQYLVISKNECMLIDAGYICDDIISYITKNKLTLKYIYLTHEHIDHIGSLNFYKSKFPNATSLIFKDALKYLKKEDNKDYKIDKYFNKDFNKITIGNLDFDILITKGHSPGSTSIYNKENNILFSGDTLFYMSIGRTDFYLGDYEKIKHSLNKIMKLPENTKVYPGHGIETDIYFEKRFNPFLNNY